MRIFDNHIHLSPTGKGIEAAKIFENAGGTAMLLVHSPLGSIPQKTLGDYELAIERTLDLAQAVRSQTELKVYVSAGPYPVELLKITERIGLAKAIALQKEALDFIGHLISEGRCTTIGEIGRPHFPVDGSLVKACDEVTMYGMKVAKEVDSAVIIHSEEPTSGTFTELARMADTVGLKREKVVKHHCPPIVDNKENLGIMPSVLAKENLILTAYERGSRLFLETDYLDDLKRPGAVLGPATVPRRTKSLLERGLVSADFFKEIHEEWPRRIYDIET